MFTAGPEIQQQCEDQGVNRGDLDITEAQRKELRAEISGRFSGIINTFVSATASGKDIGATASDNASKFVTGSNILFAAVICVLSILSFFFLFLWAITECCCKKTCCVEEQKKDAPRGKLRICVWIFSAVVAITTLILVIIWAAYLKSSVNTFKDTKCGIAILYSNMLNGANLEGGKVFMGITPLQKTLSDLSSSLDGILALKTQANNIVAQGLDTKGTDAVNAFKTYNTSVTASLVGKQGYLGALDGVTPVASVFLTALPEIVKQALSTEVTTLQSIGNQINDGAKTISTMDASSVTSTKNTINSLSTTIDSTVKSNLQSMYNSVTSGGTTEAAQSVANTAFVVSLVIVIIFTVIFLGVLYITAYADKCHWLSSCLKLS